MRKRKRIEDVFGWGKTVGGLTQLKVRGLDKVKAVFHFTLAAYNIERLPKLLQSRGEIAENKQKTRPHEAIFGPMETENCDHATRLRVRNWFFSGLLKRASIEAIDSRRAGSFASRPPICYPLQNEKNGRVHYDWVPTRSGVMRCCPRDGCKRGSSGGP